MHSTWSHEHALRILRVKNQIDLCCFEDDDRLCFDSISHPGCLCELRDYHYQWGNEWILYRCYRLQYCCESTRYADQGSHCLWTSLCFQLQSSFMCCLLHAEEARSFYCLRHLLRRGCTVFQESLLCLLFPQVYLTCLYQLFNQILLCWSWPMHRNPWFIIEFNTIFRTDHFI